jgi:phage internal scaffolding protein
MADIAFRSAYSPAIRVAKVPMGDSMTQQNFKKECDVNEILKKYQKTGLITHLNERQGAYENFVGYDDYHTSMNAVIEARDAFLDLPAHIRKRFGNDPAEFLEFVNQPGNMDEMIELGLAKHINPEIDPPVDGGGSVEPTVEPGTGGTEGGPPTVTEGS